MEGDYLSANHELIAKNIVKYRMMNNLSQKELAQILEISPGSLSAIERGRKKIGVNRLLKISNTLKVSLDSVLEGNLKYIQNDSSSPLDPEFITKLQTLSSEQKEIYDELLDVYFREVKT